MRRDSAQKKPAFTAGGSREAEMATPTRDPASIGEVQQDKTLLYIYIYIYIYTSVATQNTEGHPSPTWDSHEHPHHQGPGHGDT